MEPPWGVVSAYNFLPLSATAGKAGYLSDAHILANLLCVFSRYRRARTGAGDAQDAVYVSTVGRKGLHPATLRSRRRWIYPVNPVFLNHNIRATPSRAASWHPTRPPTPHT